MLHASSWLSNEAKSLEKFRIHNLDKFRQNLGKFRTTLFTDDEKLEFGWMAEGLDICPASQPPENTDPSGFVCGRLSENSRRAAASRFQEAALLIATA
jgi:hypothetical protein